MNEKDLNKNMVLVSSLCIAYHLYKYLRYRYCYEHIRNKVKRCCLPNCHSPLITSTILYNIYLGNTIHLFHFFIVSHYTYTYGMTFDGDVTYSKVFSNELQDDISVYSIYSNE